MVSNCVGFFVVHTFEYTAFYNWSILKQLIHSFSIYYEWSVFLWIQT